LLLCSGPQKGLDGLPALSKKGAAVTADSPYTIVEALIDLSAQDYFHVVLVLSLIHVAQQV